MEKYLSILSRCNFKSISGVINHIYGADIAWLKRMRTTRPTLNALHDSQLDIDLFWPNYELFPKFADLRRARESLDAILEALTNELSDADLEAIIDYTNSRGQRHRFILWQAALHMFNHQTHHRGQVAEILDQFGVTNDYSNLITTLVEPPV